MLKWIISYKATEIVIGKHGDNIMYNSMETFFFNVLRKDQVSFYLKNKSAGGCFEIYTCWLHVLHKKPATGTVNHKSKSNKQNQGVHFSVNSEKKIPRNVNSVDMNVEINKIKQMRRSPQDI